MNFGELKKLINELECEDDMDIKFKMDIYSATDIEKIEIKDGFNGNKYIEIEVI